MTRSGHGPTGSRDTRGAGIEAEIASAAEALEVLPGDLARARESAALIQQRGYARGRDLIAALDTLVDGA